MPEPRKHETVANFLGRYMGSPEAAKSFPDRKQRAAVAYSMMRERRKKKAAERG